MLTGSTPSTKPKKAPDTWRTSAIRLSANALITR